MDIVHQFCWFQNLNPVKIKKILYQIFLDPAGKKDPAGDLDIEEVFTEDENLAEQKNGIWLWSDCGKNFTTEIDG